MMITRLIVSSLSSQDGGSPALYGHLLLVPRSGGQVTIYHNNISQEKSFVLPHHISNDDHRKLSATAHHATLSKSDNRG